MPNTLLRILDANFNRAREGVRVIEEFARFRLNNETISGALKSLRHEIYQASSVLPAAQRIQARDNECDVGRHIEEAGEHLRANLFSVADANFDRVGEALRVIEEFAKTEYPELATGAKELRYRLYRIQSALARLILKDGMLDASIMVILGGPTLLPGEELVAELVDAGARLFQIRVKHPKDARVLAASREWMKLLRAHDDLCVIVNDRPDFALLLAADGVHLGQDDLDLKSARTMLGPARIIGRTAHNLNECADALGGGADYVGAGAMFASSTKEVSQIGGLSFGAQASEMACGSGVFAIGGIDLENIREVADAGIKQVAIASALTLSETPGEAFATIAATLA